MHKPQFSLIFFPNQCRRRKKSCLSKTALLLCSIWMIIKLFCSTLNIHMFQVACTEMSAQHNCLLQHTVFRWLQETEFCRDFLNGETKFMLFYSEQESRTSRGSRWSILANKVDIPGWDFWYVNDLKLVLQDRNTDLFQHVDKMRSLLMKMKLWRTHVYQSRIDMFSCLSGAMRENELVRILWSI